MTNITDEQRKEALEYVETKLDMGESIGWYDKKTSEMITRIFHTLRSALEPKTVSMEDAINLFPFLCDIYNANSDPGTEFILWLNERGIRVHRGINE